MASLALWDISLQARQECICAGRSWSDVAEGVETGSVVSYWASSVASLVGRAGVQGEAGAEDYHTKPA